MVLNVSGSWIRGAEVGPAPGTRNPGTLTPGEMSAGAMVLADAVYQQWCTAVGADHRSESAWLVEVSHALRRASRSLDPSDTIG